MVDLVRRLRVGARLGWSFGLLAVLIAVVSVVGVLALNTMHAAQEGLVRNINLTRDVLEMKYAATDVNGWQTAYVLDARNGVADATDDNGASRSRFLASISDFREHLDSTGGYDLTDSMRARLATAEQGLESYLALDGRVVDLLRQGTPAAAAEASTLTTGEALRQFQSIVDDVTGIADEVEAVSIRVEADASSTYEAARTTLIVCGIIAVLIAIMLALVITRSITGPLERAVDVLDATARGDLTQRVGDHSRDEVAQLGRRMDGTLDTLNATIHGIRDGSATLSASSEELSAVSTQMGAAAEETAVQASTVSAAAEQVSHSLQAVSAGAEELTASIQEISSSTGRAAAVASEAVVVAGDAQSTVSQLGESSAEIGEVIKAITSIAQQTKMLALNATIEAARAGEAGKGFAVVASEVKELARVTAESSEEIARRIEGIQADSREAVKAIDQITAIIGQINDIQLVVAAAVEQQSVTTRDIGHSLSDAAAGSADIARNITGVAEAAQGTTQGAADTQQAAQQLARLSADLLVLVEQFQLADRSMSRPGTSGTGNGGPPSP